MKNTRDVPKLNKEKFLAWKTLMKMHISSITNAAINVLRNEYVVVENYSLTNEELKQNLDHIK